MGSVRSPMRTSPRSTTTSPSATDSRRAAIARSLAWTSRQASRTDMPMNTDERLADVCWSYGTTAVSPITTVTQSSGAPSSPAAIWAKIVRAPWPMSEVPALTITLPSASRRTVEYDSPVVGPDLSPTARPRPRPSGKGLPHPISSAARLTVPAQSPSAGVSPGMNGSPGRARFWSRSASGSMARHAGRLVHVRFDRPDLLRIAEPAERGRWRGVRQDAPPDDPDSRGRGRGRPPCNCPSTRSGRRCPRRRRSGSSPRCRGRRACRRDRKPDRTWTSDAPRRTAWNVSSSESTRRTGRPVASAMNATSGSSLACCLPPNAPPGSGARTRTLASGRPQDPGEDLLEPVRVLDRTPDGDPVAIGRGHERVRLDRELGDHREGVGALDDDVGLGGRGVNVAPAVAVLAQDVGRGERVAVRADRGILDERCRGIEGASDREDRRAVPRARRRPGRRLPRRHRASRPRPRRPVRRGSCVSPTASTGRSWNCGPKRGIGWGRSAAVITSRTPGTASAARRVDRR